MKVTPERLLTDFSFRRSLPSAQWLPDGSHIVLSLNDRGPKGLISWIELVEVKSGMRKRLERGSRPIPSPDGKYVAYLARKDSATQIWIRSLRQGDKRQVTRVPGGLGADFYTSFSWSPDSRRLAFAFRPIAKPEKPNAASVVVIGAEGDIPPDSQVWVIDVDSGSARKVATGPYRMAALSWFPDGKALLCAVHRSFKYRRDDGFGEVRRIDISSGKCTTIIKDSGVQRLRPVLSPDGRFVAFLYDPANLVYPFHRSIAVVPSTGGPVRQLTRDRMVESVPVWSLDGTCIYYVGRQGVFRQLFSVTMSGEVQQLTQGGRNIVSPVLSPDGCTLVWTTEDPLGQKDVCVANADGNGERVLIDLTPEVKKLTLGDVHEVHWKSRDGLEIAGLVVHPPDYDSNCKYPLLVDLHGGPVGGVSLIGSILMRSPLEWQMWAEKGFVVFVPDYRSSVTYGWDEVLEARENQDADDRDFDDIMSGIDHIIATNSIDLSRLVLIGHSNGAHLTNWIITKTNRFKVAVSYEGNAEWYMAWGSGARVGGNSILEWFLKGKPWEAPENYLKAAAYRVGNVKTPTLFISGDKGIPLYHNKFLYSALGKLGIDTQLLVYRGEGHVIQRPDNLRDLLTRVIAWIDSHIGRS